MAESDRPPEEPDAAVEEDEAVERAAVERRWLDAAAGRDPDGLLEHLWALRRRPRG